MGGVGAPVGLTSGGPRAQQGVDALPRQPLHRPAEGLLAGAVGLENLPIPIQDHDGVGGVLEDGGEPSALREDLRFGLPEGIDVPKEPDEPAPSAAHVLDDHQLDLEGRPVGAQGRELEALAQDGPFSVSWWCFMPCSWAARWACGMMSLDSRSPSTCLRL